MTLRLRPARPTDAGAVGDILSGFTDATDWMPRLHTRAEDLAHAGRLIDRGWVTVAEEAGRVLGFLARDGEEVVALFVAPAGQGRGMGKALLDAAKADCPRLALWTFQANTPARRFYRREGFHETDQTDGSANDEGLPDVHLRWHRRAAP